MGLSIPHLVRWLAWQLADPVAPAAETPANITVFSSSAASDAGR
ncbi:MAG: hypothetical protein ACJ764_05580 [Solirubrobacteraceae bacterium]